MAESVKVSMVMIVWSLWVVCFIEGESSSDGPSPTIDCSSLILNMADCLSFVSNDSTTTRPEGTCCSGLKTVLKADADCLCQAYRSSAQLGVVLNVTKALSLPAACQVSAPAAAKCGLSISPITFTVISPSSSQISSPAQTPEMVTGANEVASTPASSPAPASSDSSTIYMSLGSLLSGLGFAIFSSF